MRRLHVIVAGADVAGLEAMFALRALAGAHVDVTLLAGSRSFEYRPIQVRDPLAVHARVRVPLAILVGAADLRYDRLVAVDVAARRVHTAAGAELPYDALVIAEPADADGVPAGALLLDEAHPLECHAAISDVLAGRARSLAFVEPVGPTHPFELYEVAIGTAVAVRRDRIPASLTLVTADSSPLSILGDRAAAMLQETLGAHGVRLVTSAYPRSAEAVAADRVIATPRLAGPGIDGLPCDRDGFLGTDVHGRVRGADGVFAAGDCTTFPIKHPSLAAQQAHAVATSIAAGAGARVGPRPFKPVLRCLLPTRLHWYVEAPLTGGLGDAARISTRPLWLGDLRCDAPYLAPHLDPAADVLAS
jgi:sulfide:quinone oxidoreductase